jgi:hypothetical protein
VNVDTLLDAWKGYGKRGFQYMGVKCSDYSIIGASELARSLKYDKTDVEAFAIALAEFQDELGFHDKAGVFLSALINNCAQDDFTIQTGQFAYGINHLGSGNTKKVTVVGDVGNFFGEHNRGGVLRVKGNAGWAVGDNMEDGLITVDGFSSPCCSSMKGGVMILNNVYGVIDRWEQGCIEISGPASGTLFIIGDFHTKSPMRIRGAAYEDGSIRNDGKGVIYIAGTSNLKSLLERADISGGNIFYGDKPLEPQCGKDYASKS